MRAVLFLAAVIVRPASAGRTVYRYVVRMKPVLI